MSETKTVFVSGSNRGIGKASVEIFAKRGWNVIAHSRKEHDEFNSFLENIRRQYNVNVFPVYFDMQDEDEMKSQIKSAISIPKIKLDALINNAGMCDIKLFMFSSMADIRNMFDVNLFSHMRLTQLLLKRMPEGGSIVNVSSIDGIEPQMGETAYAASKAAMIAWTKVLSSELNGKIRVNAIAPYAVDTDMAQKIEKQAAWEKESLIDPYDIAKAIFFLASDDAGSVTGEIMKIKGKHS